MVPLNDNKQQHTTKTNHAKEAKEHCVRFAVVIYGGERGSEERRERGGRDQQNHTPHTQFSKLKIFECIVKSSLLPSAIRLFSRRRTQRT